MIVTHKLFGKPAGSRFRANHDEEPVRLGLACLAAGSVPEGQRVQVTLASAVDNLGLGEHVDVRACFDLRHEVLGHRVIEPLTPEDERDALRVSPQVKRRLPGRVPSAHDAGVLAG